MQIKESHILVTNQEQPINYKLDLYPPPQFSASFKFKTNLLDVIISIEQIQRKQNGLSMHCYLYDSAYLPILWIFSRISAETTGKRVFHLVASPFEKVSARKSNRLNFYFILFVHRVRSHLCDVMIFNG